LPVFRSPSRQFLNELQAWVTAGSKKGMWEAAVRFLPDYILNRARTRLSKPTVRHSVMNRIPSIQKLDPVWPPRIGLPQGDYPEADVLSSEDWYESPAQRINLKNIDSTGTSQVRRTFVDADRISGNQLRVCRSVEKIPVPASRNLPCGAGSIRSPQWDRKTLPEHVDPSDGSHQLQLWPLEHSSTLLNQSAAFPIHQEH